jgi:hypothetical protein
MPLPGQNPLRSSSYGAPLAQTPGLVSLALMNGHPSGAGHTEPDFATTNVENSDLNLIADHDALAAFSGQNQHALPPVSHNATYPLVQHLNPRHSPDAL